MQSLTLPIGINDIPLSHHTHNTPAQLEHANHNPAHKLMAHPAPPDNAKEKNKPPTIPYHKNPITLTAEPTPPPFTELAKHYPILSHQERQKIISAARRRGTRRKKLHHDTDQHPLSVCWPDIKPQSLPITLYPPTPAPTHTSHSIYIIGRTTAPLTNTTPRHPHSTTQ